MDKMHSRLDFSPHHAHLLHKLPSSRMSSENHVDSSEIDTEEDNPSGRVLLRHGCEDPWTWNRVQKSPEVKLHGATFRTAYFHPNWSSGTAGVRGTRILNNGRYFWELHLSQRIFGTSMMFGIGTRRARLHADSFTNLLGEDNEGWGLSHKGILWHGGRWFHYTKPFRENVATRIGLLFDGIAGTLTFYKDGNCLGVAFRGLNEVKDALYPIICSTAAKTEIRLHITRRDFVNLQDRCRAIIVNMIEKEKDLDELDVPIVIRRYLREAMVDVVDLSLRSVNPIVSNNIVCM